MMTTAGIGTHNLSDLPDLPDDTERRLVVELPTQFRGNRVTSRFYPDQYAKVIYAKWLQQTYRRDE